jgi:hypothetical protein
MVAKYPPNSIESALGHLDQVRAGLRSTAIPTVKDETVSDMHPTTSLTGAAAKTRTITSKLVSGRDLHRLYSDLPGRFPISSALGNEYVLLFFYEEGNYIHPEPVSNRSGEQQAKAHASGLAFFKKLGVTSHDYAVLDNEISPEVRQVYSPVCAIQFVPPNTHRANKAERGIRTFVNHFIAILCGCDPTFPMKLWDELLPQAEVTLNMLRSSALSVHVSAYQHLRGTWDWNRYPLAPLGMLVVTHDSADQRASWADHGEKAFYLGPSMHHYRTHRVHCIRTNRQRDSDTVSWHPHSKLLLPFNSPADTLMEDISRLVDSLQAYIELPGVMQRAPRISQRTVPLVLDAINLVRASFLPTPGAGAQSPTDSPVASQRVAAANIRRPVSNTQRPAGSQRVADDSITGIEPAGGEPADSTETPVILSVTPVTIQRVDEQSTTTEANAERIVAHKGHGKHLLFRVRWVGYTSKDDTWEPITNVRDCIAFEDYCKKYPQFSSLDEVVLSTAAAVRISSAMHSQAKGVSASVSTAAPWSGYGYIGYNFHSHSTHANEMSLAEAIEHTCAAVGSNTTDGQTYRYPSARLGPDGDKWTAASETEFIRLVEKHKTMEFISEPEIPAGTKMMYYNPVLTKKLKNGEYVYRVRGTAGGNNSSYEGDTAAYVADMTTFKILCNKTISDEGKRMSTADISDMYLHSKLEEPEYMWVRLCDIPPATMQQFNIKNYITSDSTKVAVRIKGGMYGLPQAGRLAQEKLVKVLYDHGYYMCKSTTCLFKHKALDTEFTLTVDDFAISHLPKDLQHLLDALKSVYPITFETGTSIIDYIGFKAEFNYNIPIRTCKLSMPGYMKAACDRFGIHPTTNTHNPELYIPVVYGSKAPQMAKEDVSVPLSPADKTLVQQIVGVVLWYARGVDGTMLKAVNSVGSAQANPTEAVKAAAIHLLHYGHTYPNASITYRASDMILSIDADASYLGETGARSRAASTFKFVTRDNPDYENGLIECISTIIPTIVTGAAEAEYAGLFIAGQTGLAYRYTLQDLNCPQPDAGTRITCDNLTSGKIAHRKWKQKRSKPMDMRYHWVRDRCDLKDFYIEWRKGEHSIADLLTKSHPTPHFLSMRKHYVDFSPPTFPTAYSRRHDRRSAA